MLIKILSINKAIFTRQYCSRKSKGLTFCFPFVVNRESILFVFFFRVNKFSVKHTSCCIIFFLFSFYLFFIKILNLLITKRRRAKFFFKMILTNLCNVVYCFKKCFIILVWLTILFLQTNRNWITATNLSVSCDFFSFTPKLNKNGVSINKGPFFHFGIKFWFLYFKFLWRIKDNVFLWRDFRS